MQKKNKLSVSLDKLDQENLDALCERTGKSPQEVAKLALAMLHQRLCVDDNKAPVSSQGPFVPWLWLYPQWYIWQPQPVYVPQQPPPPTFTEPWWTFPVTISDGAGYYQAITSPNENVWISTLESETKGD
jgi:hypothetical protein